MSKKFFNLIHGESIHIAPGTKIVPASEFSKLINADDVLNHARTDAETYKKETVAECEKQKELGRREGFEKGFNEWADKLAELAEEIKTVRGEVEKVTIPIALKAAKKIVGKELEIHDDTIADIVASTLRTVASHKKIIIWCNRNDLENLEKNKNKLKAVFENLESLSVRERDDVKSGCIIETDRGIIDAQLDNQWEILEKAFNRLMVPKAVTEKPPATEPEEEVEIVEIVEEIVEGEPGDDDDEYEYEEEVVYEEVLEDEDESRE